MGFDYRINREAGDRMPITPGQWRAVLKMLSAPNVYRAPRPNVRRVRAWRDQQERKAPGRAKPLVAFAVLVLLIAALVLSGFGN